MQVIGTDAKSVHPEVSVVLPVFNHERYVVEAIESVRSQDFHDWELIIVDDGSTDDSLRVVRAHLDATGDARITLLSQVNGGSHAAINRGLQAARGNFLSILNSDDRYAASRLSRLVRLARADQQDLFITTLVKLIDADGLEVTPNHPAAWWSQMYDGILDRLRVQSPQDTWRFARALLWGNFTVSTSNFFLSRSLYAKLGPFCAYRYVLDWHYALQAAISFPQAIRFLADEALLDYRIHGANTILGGRIRNHQEAGFVLRRAQKALIARGQALPPWAMDRTRYLDRFIRQELGREYAVQRARELASLNARIDSILAQKDALQHQQERLLDERDRLKRESDHLRSDGEQLRHVLEALHASTSWRMTAPLRWVAGLLRAAPELLRRAPTALRRKSTQGLHKSIPPLAAAGGAYEEWLRQEQRRIVDLRSVSQQQPSQTDQGPFISVVVPVYNTDPAMLRAAVASVRAQIHDDWQLVISDDASTSPGTQAELQRIAASDERIAVHRCSERGHISRTTNAALASCTGDYVAFLDHDDELAPHALLLVAQALRADPSIDLLYTDEDKLDSHGKRCLPLFKPDWSPVLSWSQNYVGHLMCVRRSLLEQVGGMRTGAEGSQDHDLLLRLAERGAKVHHLPEVLYHWRIHEASTAARPAAKPYAHEAGRRSVLSHLQVRYPEHLLQVDDGDSAFVYQPRFRVPESARASIIIPTKDRLDLLVPCVQSILTKSTWPHFELVLLDNASSQHDTCQWLEEIQRVNSRVRVVPAHMPFNWSRLNNLGRSQAIGEVLVFLNNDTLVITPDWLQKLMQWALLPDVGTVGPMLLFEDGSVQHAGVVVGMGGWADHVYRQSQPVNYPSPYIANVVTRNVLANTGACVAIATAKFDQLGGWDETFQICGSDVELGIRAHERGLHNVYLPSVRLYHLESKTRSPHVPEVDFEQSALKYGRYRTHGDPFYNPHLDPMSTTPRPLHRLVRNLPSPRGRLS